MNAIDAWAELKSVVEAAWLDRRVTPVAPAGRKPRIGSGAEMAIKPPRRDPTSSWSVYINYVDRDGYESERRITCLNVTRAPGGALAVGSYCHEAGSYREFRVDRITELVDLASGEVAGAADYFARLKREGLPFSDRGMAAFTGILVFMMRCDGHDDPREWDAIERALASYALRHDGDDADVEQALANSRAIAPDHEDFGLALQRLLRAPRESRRSIADLCGRACAAVVDADGRLVDAELHWGAAIDRCLGIIRG